MNMMAIACGDTAILVDAGVMFPEPELLGVDLIIPDLRPLQQYRIQALVLTHGHEDHIGAVPHVLPLVHGPVYGTPLTIALVESKLDEQDEEVRNRLVRVKPRERVTSPRPGPRRSAPGAGSRSRPRGRSAPGGRRSRPS